MKNLKYRTVCGLDEAGRGALAGPLVAAAVNLNRASTGYISKFRIPIRDSKVLSKKSREIIYQNIIDYRIEFITGIIEVDEINSIGIGASNIRIFQNLIREISADYYIVDGNLKLGYPEDKNVRCFPHADAVYPAVILAGIVAKVTRDRIMAGLHRQISVYGWQRNCGYGTTLHINAIRKYGINKYHRNIFVQTALKHTDSG
jgi:ribonuclease HII